MGYWSVDIMLRRAADRETARHDPEPRSEFSEFAATAALPDCKRTAFLQWWTTGHRDLPLGRAHALWIEEIASC